MVRSSPPSYKPEQNRQSSALFNSAFNFHGKSFSNSLLVGLDLMQNILFVLILPRSQIRSKIWSNNFSDMCYLCSLPSSRFYPEAAYVPLSVLYKDEYLGSVNNPEIALILSRSLVELLNLGSIVQNCLAKIHNLSYKLHPPQQPAQSGLPILQHPQYLFSILTFQWMRLN